MDMPDADATLVSRARQGDAEAFGALIQRYLRSAYAVALAQLGNEADAEDVCQDAFVTSLRRIEECRHPDQFGVWLLSIVRNRAHDYRRYRAVRDTLPLDAASATSGRSNPLRDAERSELRRDLVDALDGLTETQREVLLLYDLEGWSHREIAEKIGITESTARVHLHKGRRTLRERLARLHPERP